MRARTVVERAIVVLSVGGAACGSPSRPAPLPPTTGLPPIAAPPSSAQTVGRIVDATTDAAVSGVLLGGDGVAPSTSNATGQFALVATTDAAAPRGITFVAPEFVGRQTFLRVPGPEARVTLIPRSFDLSAFDEMFRVSALTRWTTAPPLRIVMRTFQFTSIEDTTLLAIDDTMSAQEAIELQDDLTWALPQLTGATFGAFASVSRSTAAAGDARSLLSEGAITVARVVGLTAATGFWGYSRWRLATDGSVVGGFCMLDVGFERSGSPSRRSLRSHELGHALGYNHVTGRPSVMNPSARVEPNDFDRVASRIAFGRAPGNQRPDVDPVASLSVNRFVARWSPPIF